MDGRKHLETLKISNVKHNSKTNLTDNLPLLEIRFTKYQWRKRFKNHTLKIKELNITDCYLEVHNCQVF